MAAKRLRLPAEYLKDMRGFAKRSSALFVVRYRSNQLGHIRFAVMVSNKVDGRSSERNRLKRRVREYLRVRQGGTDLFISVLPPAKLLDRKKFLEELGHLLP